MGTKLSFIHGMWGSPEIWSNQKKFFEKKGYALSIPALPHHRPPGNPEKVAGWGIADYVSALEEELAPDAENTILIGHSMGGLLTQILALRHPFKAILLITPAPPAEVPGFDPSALITFLPLAFLGDFRKKALPPNPRSFHRISGGRLAPETEKQLFSCLVPESGKAFFEMAFPYFASSASTSVPAAKIHCPVAVFCGGKDLVTPPSVVKKIHRYYPKARLFYYPDLSHGMIWEPEWEEVAQDMLQWIQEVEKKH
ncbi:pimeloyl-ACP methyl ester carboxylesterase [Desulfobotulus alkaliphilus]|uniref:Pimeloyl-ACP methyl ester carboxylesterase n=1 Tax=Desulfobotulus alkaliphilus TaxID=622671 RepID=A0A562RQP4_9BACT|nr:alpha/beta hydrolase [Desulfobotulus alkaliphilus]TWI70650.1 pimeloyl-ACP methyl ester carboxylesterase [Desulfobotulus alkaliphilus]